MKWISFLAAGEACIGAGENGRFVNLNAAEPGFPRSLKEVFAAGTRLMDRARHLVEQGKNVIQLDQVKWLPPIPDPQKVICVGLNYADHAKESGQAPPPEPVLFCKFTSSLLAHGEPIVLPKVSQQVDYEAELVVVIGKQGRHIPEDQALSHIAGYAPGHDVSARDWQLKKPGGQWLMGKTFDTFAPYGPWITGAEDVPNPGNLQIKLRLNGKVMQDSSTSQLIFSVPSLVSYISQVCTLLPGDIIFTGTPPGVGMARKPPVFLQPGDLAEVEIEKLGTLRNSVIAE